MGAAFGPRPASGRRRILIVAYQCSPFRWSEWAVGWGRLLETARYFDTWVITSGLSKPDIERYSATRGLPAGVHFHFVEADRIQKAIEWLPSMGAYHYPAYNYWHRRVLLAARELHARHRFDLVHQVNVTGFREPGYLWKLGVPFIWGPVGGTQLYPWRFLLSAGVRGCLVEGFRNILNVCQLRLSPRVHRAARGAAALLTANSQGYRDMWRVYGAEPVLLLETGLPSVAGRANEADPARPLRIFWCGDLSHRKALHLLLRALSRLPKEVVYELRVAGSGPLFGSLRKLAERLGVTPRCEWMGNLPHDEVLEQCAWADVFAFTSLRDTSGNVVLEALSRGCPVICLDHQGAGDMVDASSGIKIPVSTPGRVVEALREALEKVARDRAMLRFLSNGAIARAKEFLWSRNGERMAEVYRSALSVESRAQS
jgi:glycosyltransferase involved in cell wall biosynthesis